MAAKDDSNRESRIVSIVTMYNYQWLLLWALRNAVAKHLGGAGMKTLERGFRRYGYYRGQHLRDRPVTFAEGRDALSLLRNWDTSDFHYAALQGPVEISGSPARATVKLPCVPGSIYYESSEGGDMLEPFWRNMLPGLAEGYDETVSVEFDDVTGDSTRPWSMTWTYPGEPDDEQTVLSFPGTQSDPMRSIEINRRTYGTFAALHMYVGFQLTEEYPDKGEAVLREALYEFGLARGRELRERADAKGKPINFTSWLEELQERDPAESVFTFRGETVASPGVWAAECTYCPLATVWAEEGHRGLAMGYLYDVENHRGLVQGFHPGGEVQWDDVKTRGDKTCRFRFWIPELVAKDDPDWAQPEHKLEGL